MALIANDGNNRGGDNMEKRRRVQFRNRGLVVALVAGLCLASVAHVGSAGSQDKGKVIDGSGKRDESSLSNSREGDVIKDRSGMNDICLDSRNKGR